MKSSTKDKSNTNTIDTVEKTTDTLSSRAGLALFVRYLRGIAVGSHLERLFGSIRKTRKGLPVVELFKQLFCFFVDGTSRHLVYFDQLKKDEGYARTIETDPGAMVSSHGVKRFFKAFRWPLIYLFRRLLQQLFLWRLRMNQPPVVVLNLDTMIMDNDEACKRHGVKPTYKRVKGFQPLQLTWGRFIIDAVFRGGDKHSNHSDTVEKMIRHVVGKIRKHYQRDVAIVIRLDSGFFDQKLFKVFEELGIGYICAGRLYEDIQDYVSNLEPQAWNRYGKGKHVWEYVELGDRRKSWTKFRRVIFCRPLQEDGQLLLDFARRETVLYTNLGMGGAVDEALRRAGMQDLLEPPSIIASYHHRGSDELIHRALKDFGFEELPFKRFAPNAAFYYTMLTAFFLYECFKEDVCAPQLATAVYATTVRRKLIDVAAKIVHHAGKIVLKVTAAAWDALHFDDLWRRSGKPPQFKWV